MYLQIFNTKHYTFPNLSALGLFPGVYKFRLIIASIFSAYKMYSYNKK